MYPYVSRMPDWYVTRMYPYVLVCFSYVTRILPVCTLIRMSLVCARMYPYVSRMSPVWCISHDPL